MSLAGDFAVLNFLPSFAVKTSKSYQTIHLTVRIFEIVKVVSFRKTCGNFPCKSCAGRVLKIFTDHRERSSCFHRSDILALNLKVNKNENFFGSDFEVSTISLLVTLKFKILGKSFLLDHYGGSYNCSA